MGENEKVQFSVARVLYGQGKVSDSSNPGLGPGDAKSKLTSTEYVDHMRW